MVYAPIRKRLTAEYPQIAKNADALFDLPFERVRAVADKEHGPGREQASRIVVFDGERMWQHFPDKLFTTKGVARKSFMVIDTARTPANYLSANVLDHLLFSFDMPLPSERAFRRANRVPDLFAAIGFGLQQRPALVAGADCTVADAAGKERIYFDREMEFTVRKRQWFRGDELLFEFEGSEFERLANGIWFPRRWQGTQYGVKEQPGGGFVGKALFRNVSTVERLELNGADHLSFFTLPVPAGAFVIDETLRRLDGQARPLATPRKGANVIPSVSYIQPANERDVAEAVRKAQYGEGRAQKTPVPLKWRRVVGVALGFGIALIGCILFVRRWRTK